MEVYRLINKKHPIELSGIGAARFGARWNSKGTEIVYTAQSRALAMAEVAVHLTLATLPSSFLMITIQIPDDIEVIDCNQKKIEIGWNEFPENTTTQIIGDEFILKKKSIV
jgi:RES domain-containing protein